MSSSQKAVVAIARTHHYEPVSGALKNWMGTCNQPWRQKHHGNVSLASLTPKPFVNGKVRIIKFLSLK